METRLYHYTVTGDRGETILDCLAPKLARYQGSGIDREAGWIGIFIRHSDEDARGLIAEKLAECDPDWEQHLTVN